MIRVLLVEDDDIYRTGLHSCLAGEADITIVGEADNGRDALLLEQSLKPDVMILDMQLGSGMSGVAVTRALGESNSSARVLVLSTHKSEAFVFGVLDAGAKGYLLKGETRLRLVEGIHRVMSDRGWWLSQEIIDMITEKQLAPKESLLSERETEVLKELAIGCNNLNIAARLEISENTVKNHLTNIYRKIGVGSRTAAIHWAWIHGLVESEKVVS